MRIVGASLLVALLFSAACNDSFPVPPDTKPTPSKVTVAATANPAQIALFRDGPGADWKAMDKGGDGSFTATVTGPYEVAVVCNTNAGGTWVTWEHADVPNAKHPETTNVTPPCNDVTTHKLTGKLTDAATVSVGTGVDQPVAAGGTFSFDVVDGTYDIVVHTATSVSVAKDPVVVGGADKDAGTVVLNPAVNLIPQTFTAKIDTDDQELASVKVLLATPNSPQASVIFSADGGTSGDKSIADINAMVLPAAGVPKDFTQQVTYAGVLPDPVDDTQTLERSTNRDFTVGDTGTILLPSGYGSVVWFADPAGMSFIGDSDPPDLVSETLTGKTTDGKVAVNTIEVTAEYQAETSLTRIILETDLTGYQPTWKVDTNQEYARTTQGTLRVDDDETDPPTHDNREWNSTQTPGAP